MTAINSIEIESSPNILDDIAINCANGLLEHFDKVISGEESSICVVIVLGVHDKIHELWLAGLGINSENLPVDQSDFVVNAKGIPVYCSVFSHPDGEPHTLQYSTTEFKSVIK